MIGMIEPDDSLKAGLGPERDFDGFMHWIWIRWGRAWVV